MYLILFRSIPWYNQHWGALRSKTRPRKIKYIFKFKFASKLNINISFQYCIFFNIYFLYSVALAVILTLQKPQTQRRTASAGIFSIIVCNNSVCWFMTSLHQTTKSSFYQTTFFWALRPSTLFRMCAYWQQILSGPLTVWVISWAWGAFLLPYHRCWHCRYTEGKWWSSGMVQHKTLVKH